MKKAGKLPSAIAVFLLFVFLIEFVPAPRAFAAEMSGECGKNGDKLTWSYQDGLLTITGQGEMEDYEKAEDVPWYDVRTKIVRIELPDGLTGIGDRAFYRCVSLTAAELPEGLTAIGDEAFAWCYSLVSVTLPEGLLRMGDRAFGCCDGLTSVELPESITDLGENPFYWCRSLTSIEVSPAHPCLETVDGVLFSWPDCRLVCFPCAFDRETYSVPEGIRSIGGYAFYDCDSLTGLSLPEGLTDIGDQAFGDCSGLTAIELPESITSIGDNPFYLCDSLTAIKVSLFHPYLAVIGGVLFSKPDHRLVCFPCAFDRKTYSVPKGIRSIGGYAFYDCRSLTGLALPESLTDIGAEAFEYCVGLSDLALPEGVTAVGEWAFAGCGGLTSLTLPDSLTAIGDGAFAGCGNLTFIVGRGSFGEQYCMDNGLEYAFPDDPDRLRG